MIGGRIHWLGRHPTEVEAALAAEAFRHKHMPFSRPDAALTVVLAGREAGS